MARVPRPETPCVKPPLEKLDYLRLAGNQTSVTRASWNELFAELNALHTSEVAVQEARERWRVMAQTCVAKEIACMQAASRSFEALASASTNDFRITMALPLKEVELDSFALPHTPAPPEPKDSPSHHRLEPPLGSSSLTNDDDDDDDNPLADRLQQIRLSRAGRRASTLPAIHVASPTVAPGRILKIKSERHSEHSNEADDFTASRSMMRELGKVGWGEDLEYSSGAYSHTPTSKTIRRHIWFILEDPEYRSWTKWVHLVYNIIIVLSVGATIFSTLENLPHAWQVLISVFEYCFNGLFSVEVLLRFIAAPKVMVNLRSMYFWMDVAAVTPFYVRMISGMSPRDNLWIELISLLIPILRLLKVTRHSNGWRLLVFAMRQCLDPLSVPFFFLSLLTIFCSCIIYWVEEHSSCIPDPQLGPNDDPDCIPDNQNAFKSIPHCMWFVLVTIATVGYGDTYPNTNEGKLACSLLIVVGVCYLSMPLTIVGSTFWSVWENRDVILIREKTRERFRGLKKSSIMRVFEMADEDKSGTVTFNEFNDLIQCFDVGMTQRDIKRMFKSIDEDKSGEIVFEEFLHFLFPEIADANED